MKRVASAAVGAIAALVCISAAAAGPVDLRAFDGRASTLLRRLKEAGMPVHRLASLGALRVPRLADGVDAEAALKALAQASGLELTWQGATPLLYQSWRGHMTGAQVEPLAREAADWEGDARIHRAMLKLAREDAGLTARQRRAMAASALRHGRAGGCALLNREGTILLVRLALKDSDWLLRRQAVLAAADLRLPDAARIVAKAAADQESEVVRAAALAAGRLGGKKGLAILEKLLDPSPLEKRWHSKILCAVTYGCAEHGTPEAAAVLGKLVPGEDAYVAAWALRGAGRISHPAALALLKRGARHKDPRLRRGAALGLATCRVDGAVEILRDLVLDDASTFVRPQGPAAIALGRQGGDRAVEILLEAWKKGERIEIVYGLGLAGGEKATAALRKMRKHEDAVICRAAAFALEEAKPADTSAVRVEGLGVAVYSRRPRVFLRPGNEPGWTGPSVPKLRANFSRPDHQRVERKGKLPNTAIGQAVLWLATGDEFAELDAVAWASEAVDAGFHRARGKSPSYAGISVQRVAAMYDWLHGHGDIDPITRRLMMHHLETFAGGYLDHWLKRKASSVFYSRRWGALGAVGVAGLALFGDSPRAREMVEYAAHAYAGADGLGTIRQAQDGATGGSCYGLHHAFTDCANLAAALASATTWDVAAHIRDKRGDWLAKQLYFQMHCTYPDGSFLKDGDRWGSAVDSSQYRMQVDVISGLYRSGVARSWALNMAKRYPKYYPSDYHTEFVWQFFVFNAPDVEAAPLSGCPRAMLFSRAIDGYCLWRSSWKPDATIVHFRGGDSLDMHGTHDTGKFVIYKHKPLATKNGAYIGYGSPIHRYYGSATSANCVIFDDGRNGGRQTAYRNRAGGVASFKEFLAVRPTLGPPTGRILKHEVTDDYAYAAADLSGSTPDKGAANRWVRRICFLGYRYVIVLDRVRTAPGTTVKWPLNFDVEPTVDGPVQLCSNPPGKLFCRTLLPAKVTIRKIGGKDAPKVMRTQWTTELTGPDPGAAEQTFLSVLEPTTAGQSEMAPCAFQQKAGAITVTVGGLSFTFKNDG